VLKDHLPRFEACFFSSFTPLSSDITNLYNLRWFYHQIVGYNKNINKGHPDHKVRRKHSTPTSQQGTEEMPLIEVDGLKTHYEVLGDGPPILMCSPGGFDARIEQWTDLGVYKRIKLLEHLPKQYKCILFDRRENGRSDGRVEQITWTHYAQQAAGLLDHLKIDQAHILGGCMGCSVVVAFGVLFPDRTLSMILYWPVGGVKYRLNSHNRFIQHIEYVRAVGLEGVIGLVRSHNKNFSADPRGGPWGQTIRNSHEFADQYASLNQSDYITLITSMFQGLIDRDTSPGANPEDLMKIETASLIIPGDDDFHAKSAARYLHECLPNSQYWDIPTTEQNEDTVPSRIIDFLDPSA